MNVPVVVTTSAGSSQPVTFEAVTSAFPTPHDYFDRLAARPDRFAAYSLRDDAQVRKHSTYLGPRDLAYIYPNDPDPRRQDAMRMLTREDQSAPKEGLLLPLGDHHPQNLLVVEDRWWGAEYSYSHSKIGVYKGDPYFESGRGNNWFAVRSEPITAAQNTHNQPPGGPYVLMLNPQSLNASQLKEPFFRGVTKPELARLPYGAPYAEQRNYGEGVMPRDTSVRLQGAEFGVVAERWTRIWHFFERASALDWVESTVAPVGDRRAYRWSMWAADTVRDPIRLLNGAILGIAPGSTGITHWRMHMGVGGAYAGIPPGRGPMVAYARNVVVLHGTSKADVLTLLQKPVN